MKCFGCGSVLREIQYQSRSADEAQTSVHRCPQCPLNIGKFLQPLSRPHLYLQRQKRSRNITPIIDILAPSTLMILRVSTKHTNIYSASSKKDARACNVLSGSSCLFKCYSTGPWAGLSLSKTSSQRLTLNAEVLKFDRTCISPMNRKEYTDFEFIEIDDGSVIVEDNSMILVQILSSESEVSQKLERAYSLGFVPDALSTYISGIVLGSMSNMNARAYDAFDAADYRHLFTTKPDGERMWLVRSGIAWFYCRRLLGFRIEAWKIESDISYTTDALIGPVIDIEMMMGFPSILIDVLADDNIILSPYDRTIDWIHDKMKSLVQKYSVLSIIHMRQFFNNRKDAELYSKTVPYPIDGLVAISIYSTDMKKLKQAKSMELRMSNNGYLVSKENVRLLKLHDADAYPIDSIVEIRFSMSARSIDIHSHFRRLDKVSANGTAAISSIIASCMEPESNSVIRTALWRWSNKVRFYMYEKAFTMNRERNIVMDIGSGTGQSSEAFEKMPGCSFILVEPDASKCKLLAKRLGVRKIHTNPRSLIPEIPALRRCSTRYHILNVTLQRILLDTPCMNNLKGTLKCTLACFSTQFIADSLEQLSSIQVPFIGSFYSYDNVEVNNSIADFANIKMNRISESEAIVKWGSDEAYREPVIDIDDIPFTMSSVSAIDIVNSPTIDKEGDMHKLCSCLKILISR